MNATLVPLVKYHSLFRRIWWLTESEAQAKLVHEQPLYERWLPEFGGQIAPPWIERAPFNTGRSS